MPFAAPKCAEKSCNDLLYLGSLEVAAIKFMTDQQLSEENHYRFEERLAIMCGLDQPTAAQICLAIEEAAEACDKLRKE